MLSQYSLPQHTLVVSPRESEDTNALFEAALKSGWQAERLDSWHAPEQLIGRHDLVLYGEALFVRALADQLSIVLLEAPLTWLAELPAACTQRAVRAIRLGEVTEIEKPTFIKPAGDKAFPGQVYASGQALLDTVPDLSRSITVLTAEPVSWQAEFRCFVLNRSIQTVSMYLRDGNITRSADGLWERAPDLEAGAHAFAQSVVGDSSIRVPPACVLDVGIIEGRGWAVLEANPAWASGIYGCDPLRILPVLARACIPENRLQDAERQWIPEWESWDL